MNEWVLHVCRDPLGDWLREGLDVDKGGRMNWQPKPDGLPEVHLLGDVFRYHAAMDEPEFDATLKRFRELLLGLSKEMKMLEEECECHEGAYDLCYYVQHFGDEAYNTAKAVEDCEMQRKYLKKGD